MITCFDFYVFMIVDVFVKKHVSYSLDLFRDVTHWKISCLWNPDQRQIHPFFTERCLLGGVFFFLFTPKFWEDSHFD